MKVLHVVASPRGAQSNTIRVAESFLERLTTEHQSLEVTTLDLFHEALPVITGHNIEAKYTLMGGQALDRNHAESWQHIERLIAQFLAADLHVLSVPMWNFSIPYALKYYIDAIVQPGYLFAYSAEGVPTGLCQDKTMVCVTSRGADYSAGGPMHSFDFQEPYLRAIFGFVGLTDMHFINAQPMDITAELREAAIVTAVEAAKGVASTLARVGAEAL